METEAIAMGNNMRLGKGLEALLGNVAASAPAEQDESKESVRILSINQIDPNPYQPRQEFDEAEMQELADSIAMHGVIQPILVTSHGQGRYTLVAGERRCRARRKACLSESTAILRTMDDRALREIALIENLQRVNLNPVEEAESISLLMQEYGLTQENVSERVGKSRSAVANALRLLSLPSAVLQMVRDGKLSSGHARAVLSVPGEDRQLAFAEEIVKQGYSVREAEKRAKLWKEEAARPAKKKAVLDLHLRSAQEELQQRLGTKVELTGTPEKGKISISYFSPYELERLYALLGGRIEQD